VGFVEFVLVIVHSITFFNNASAIKISIKSAVSAFPTVHPTNTFQMANVFHIANNILNISTMVNVHVMMIINELMVYVYQNVYNMRVE
jgi:hypothetical protein